MLKKLLTTSALCTISLAAYAADLPLKQPVYKAPVAAPLYNWTGFYAGGNIGYSWGHSDVAIDSAPAFGLVFAGLDPSARPNGVIGGLQAGYNWQQSRNWVWGLEADFQWSGQKGTATESGSFGPLSGVFDPAVVSGMATGTLTSKLTWLGTLRGRVGYVADGLPGVLWYATGGLAYGRFKTSFAGSASGICSGGALNVCSSTEGFTGTANFASTQTKVGGTVGVGAEGDLGNFWTWKIEYLYVDLGTANETVPISGTACHFNDFGSKTCASFTGNAAVSSSMTDHIVRLGFNRRFGS
jgi:outer membrane immunogenic protein